MIKENRLVEKAIRVYKQGKRLVAPLMSFPGVKLAQQNCGEHFRAIQKLVWGRVSGRGGRYSWG